MKLSDHRRGWHYGRWRHGYWWGLGSNISEVLEDIFRILWRYSSKYHPISETLFKICGKKKEKKKEKQKKKKAPLGTTTSTGTVITYSGAMNIQEQCLISPFTNTFQAISSAACSGLKTFIFLLTTELKKERECIEKYIYDINDELVQVAIMAWNWDGIPAEMVNTLRPRQNGRHFADDVLKSILLNGNVWIPIKISLKFVPKGPIDNIPTLV